MVSAGTKYASSMQTPTVYMPNPVTCTRTVAQYIHACHRLRIARPDAGNAPPCRAMAGMTGAGGPVSTGQRGY
ncbi:hypothetical protein Cme02nite_28470 [Catellatospora methionotrophica]|uniref:Uncharacterized protein n=1 Tax=Catellatospora methionotrophica TaxID=121620 RepID=A0A8J3LHC2_9ACTN|nr:hypothetical protein Cme02nite_28470 [Catellatospora methionotrophica]